MGLIIKSSGFFIPIPVKTFDSLLKVANTHLLRFVFVFYQK